MSGRSVGRSVVVRLQVSREVWQYFQALRDHARTLQLVAKIPRGDTGTRLVLRVWLEQQLEALDKTRPDSVTL